MDEGRAASWREAAPKTFKQTMNSRLDISSQPLLSTPIDPLIGFQLLLPDISGTYGPYELAALRPKFVLVLQPLPRIDPLLEPQP